jgi:hypothetical protein
MSWQIVIVIGAVFGAWFIWNWLRLPGSFHWNAAGRARNERERLAALPTSKLCDEVRRLIRYEQWERFASATKILAHDEWTDSALLQDLNDLYVEVSKERPGHYGRDSNVFEFHDCGLMEILEILKTRVVSHT